MNKIVKRPWGTYVVLAKSKDFLLKKIKIKPEGVLSYQSHNFRSEHWVIIEGKATVIINNRTYYKTENENIFIPKKAKHRVLNESAKKNLVINIISLNTIEKYKFKLYIKIGQSISPSKKWNRRISSKKYSLKMSKLCPLKI